MYPSLSSKEFVATYDLVNCYTKSNPSEAFGELDVAVALIREDGNLGAAARLLGRSRAKLVNFVARNEGLTELQSDIEEEFLDKIEGLHRTAALGGDIAVQRFFLTTRGRDRGFAQRLELTGKDGTPLNPETSASAKLMEFLNGVAERS